MPLIGGKRAQSGTAPRTPLQRKKLARLENLAASLHYQLVPQP